MMHRFCAYIEKVFNFSHFLSRITDSRQVPRIPSATVWLSAIIMFVTRRRSLNAIDGELRVPRRLDKFVGPIKPSGDSIGRIFAQMDTDQIRDILVSINHRLKRNKMIPLKWPLRFIAIDGHEFFSQ